MEQLLSKIPSFGDACKLFSQEAQDIRTQLVHLIAYCSDSKVN